MHKTKKGFIFYGYDRVPGELSKLFAFSAITQIYKFLLHLCKNIVYTMPIFGLSIFGNLSIIMCSKRNSKAIYLLICLFFFCVPVMGNTTAVCDSLISKGEKAFQKRDFVKSLEFFTEARSIANKNKWDRQLYTSTFNIGNAYYEMLDYGEALNYFLESYTIALKKLNYKDEIASLNNIANLYAKEKIYNKALEYYSKAYELAKEKNIDARKGLPVMNMGYIYNRLNLPNKARPYIIESMKYLKDEYLLSAKVLLAENDMLLGNTALAKKTSFTILQNPENKKIEGLNVLLWPIIASCYQKEKNYGLAAEFASKVLTATSDLNVKKDTYQLLSDIYRKSGDLNRVIQFKDSIIVAEKKLNDIKNGRLFENNRVKFEIQGYKEQLNTKELKMAEERRIYYGLFALLLVFVVIMVLIFRQKRIIAERNQHISELDLEKEKNNNLLLEKQVTDALLEQERLKVEEERLKNEVDARNRKLSAKALHLSGRNELIEEILDYLSKKPKYSKDLTLASYVVSLKQHLKTDNDWDDFIAHFEEVNSGFLSRLKTAHPTLSVGDIRFIAYMYMNLSTKEIAYILNITPLASKKRKERLASKMEIPKERDLYDYVATL